MKEAIIYIEKSQSVQKVVCENCTLHTHQQKDNTSSCHYTKIKSKWFKNKNIAHDTIQFLKENIDKIFSDILHSNNFLDLSPKAKGIKAKNNKWGIIKIKNFCTAKETINKTKR